MLNSLLLAAAEEENLRELPIHPVFIGLIALGVLIVLLIALLSFGKGREHP